MAIAIVKGNLSGGEKRELFGQNYELICYDYSSKKW
jgi:hypothetical protein